MSAPAPDAIPALRPPLNEIPASFWEQYGALVIGAAVIGIAVVGALVWLLTRPRKSIPPAPAALARQILDPLKARAEDGPLLSQVSRVLRQYLTAVFALPSEEMTTTEFCSALRGQERVGPELSGAISRFLHECDERKFAARPARAPGGVVEEALGFISAAEGQLARLGRQVAGIGSGDHAAREN